MPNIVVMKPVSGYRRIYLRRIGSILPCCLPSGKVGGLQIQRSQGLSVDDYSFTLDALTLNSPTFASLELHLQTHISIYAAGWALWTNQNPAQSGGIISYRDPERVLREL